MRFMYFQSTQTKTLGCMSRTLWAAFSNQVVQWMCGLQFPEFVEMKSTYVEWTQIEKEDLDSVGWVACPLIVDFLKKIDISKLILAQASQERNFLRTPNQCTETLCDYSLHNCLQKMSQDQAQFDSQFYNKQTDSLPSEFDSKDCHMKCTILYNIFNSYDCQCPIIKNLETISMAK